MTTHQIGMEFCGRFDGKPPYALIEHTVNMATENDISEIKIFKGSHGYQARILQGNEARTAEIENFNYSLNEHLAAETWIRAKPQIGDRIEYSNLNADTLEIDKATAPVREVRNTIVNGVKITYFTINTTFADGPEMVSVHGADGMPYSMIFGGVFEMRLEPESLAKNALLFTALARALEIPCRMVIGLVYAGDTLRAFSPHAWNEVVIDGYWIPVDPTWDQTTIDATHLRFPAGMKGWFQVLAAVPQMKLTVLDFEIKF